MCGQGGGLSVPDVLPTTKPGGFPKLGTGGDWGMMEFSKGGDWKDKLKKFGQGAMDSGVLSALDQPLQQSAPFQFSPLSEPAYDPNSSPLTQSIIASLMQQMSSRQGG